MAPHKLSVMARQNIRPLSEIFLSSTALSLRVLSRFKRFLRLSRSQDIAFFENSNIILKESAKTKCEIY